MRGRRGEWDAPRPRGRGGERRKTQRLTLKGIRAKDVVRSGPEKGVPVPSFSSLFCLPLLLRGGREAKVASGESVTRVALSLLGRRESVPRRGQLGAGFTLPREVLSADSRSSVEGPSRSAVAGTGSLDPLRGSPALDLSLLGFAGSHPPGRTGDGTHQPGFKGIVPTNGPGGFCESAVILP